MTKQVQRRRGTATQHTSFTGAEGELSVNTTNKSVHVHDGSTAGGIELARKDGSNVAFTSGTLDGVTIGGTTAGAGTFTNLTATGTTTLAGASTSANITFGDNDKAIFGAGSDLQIYHDSAAGASYIDDAGTGRLYIRGSRLTLQKYTGETMIDAVGDGAVTLYHDNNAAKLATTSTGIDVTGTAVTDALTVQTAQGNISIANTASSLDFARAGANYIRATNGSGTFNFIAGVDDFASSNLKLTSSDVIINDNSADMDFRVESDTNTHALFVRGSDSRVAINTSAPAAPLHVAGVNGTSIRMSNDRNDGQGNNFMDFYNADGRMGYMGYSSATNDNWTFWNEQNTYMNFGVNAQETLRMAPTAVVFNELSHDRDFRVESNAYTDALFVDASQDRVGIFTNSPQYQFDVDATARIQNTLHVTSTGGANYTQGDIRIYSSTADSPSYRGQGVYMFNEGADRTWYAGTMYNSAADYHIGTATGTSFNGIAASSANTMLSVYAGSAGVVVNETGADRDFRVESDNNSNMLVVNAGSDRVGIGIADPLGKFDIGDNTLSQVQAVLSRGGDPNFQTRIYNADGNNADDVVGRIQSTYGNTKLSGLRFHRTGGAQSYITFSTNDDTERMRIDGDTITLNDGGTNQDFRVESDSNTHALFVDAGTSMVGINRTPIDAFLHIEGNFETDYAVKFQNTMGTGQNWGYRSHGVNGERFSFYNISNNQQMMAFSDAGTEGVIFNEDSHNLDFRVESDGNANAIFLDAGTERLGIFSSNTAAATNYSNQLCGNVALGTYSESVSTIATSSSQSVDIPFSRLSRGVYEFAFFGFQDGGATQAGCVVHLYVMENPNRHSKNDVTTRGVTVSSANVNSNGDIRVTITNSSGTFAINGGRYCVRRMC